MKQECSIVRDLLPLYVEDMVSPETAEFVGGHLAACETCQAEYQSLRQPPDVTPPAQEERPEAPLRLLQRKLLLKRIQTALLAGVFVLVVLLSAFAILSAPQYFPYSEDLMAVTELDNGDLRITFDERVTNSVIEPGAYEGVYFVQAWTSPWEQWISHGGEQSQTIPNPDMDDVSIYYAQNNGQEDVLIYGQGADGGTVSLPRLVLGYYLFLAVGVFVVLLVVWLTARKKPKVRQWVGRALLLPPSYGVGHCIVLGFTTVSYCATRDFILIVAIGALVYCLVLLAVRLYRLWRELRPN